MKTTRCTSVPHRRKKTCCQGDKITEWFEVINYSTLQGANGTSETISTCFIQTFLIETHSNAHIRNPFKCIERSTEIKKTQLSAKKRTLQISTAAD